MASWMYFCQDLRKIFSLTSDNIEEFSILSEHLEPVAELGSPLHDVLLWMGLDLGEVTALVRDKLGSHEHLLETVQHICPKEVPDSLIMIDNEG